jgi:hypothetical protein
VTWFKVDDGLHSHRKAVRAGVPAMGLWVLAGSWSSDQLSDGWVPRYIAARLDPGHFLKHATALVKAGLWIPDQHDGEDGWWFHQWEDHQPSAKTVREQREAAKERMRRGRDKRRAKTAEHSGMFAQCSREQVANCDGTSEEVRLPRPDPTRPELLTEVPKDTSPAGLGSLTLIRGGLSSAVELPPPVVTTALNEAVAAATTKRKRTKYDYDDPDFVRFWDAYPKKVGKPAAFAAWCAAIERGADPELIIAAAAAYADDRNRTEKYTKYPQGWLNDERYNIQQSRPAQFAAGAFWDN